MTTVFKKKHIRHMNNRYRFSFTLLFTALLSGIDAWAGVTVHGSVYGGGNLADVGNGVEVNIKGGTIENDVYGGGALANTNIENWVNDELKVYDQRFGLVNLPEGTSLDGYYAKQGNNYVLLTTGTANVGTQYYKRLNTTVNLTGGTVQGDVYGGGLGQLAQNEEPAVEAKVYGDVIVNVNGTKIGNRVFGANNINGTPLGHVKVVVNKTGQREGQAIDLSAVFGGGNKAAYNPFGSEDYAEVEIEKTGDRLIVGNVYGGGNEAGITGSNDDAGTQVTIKSGDIKKKKKKKCNTSGTVSGNVSVTLTGGIIGSGTIDSETGSFAYSSKKANVHGGGYGQNTYVKGNVVVNIGSSSTEGDATIWGDVYGGGALGHVNALAGESAPTYQTDNSTTVNLNKATMIYGDAYGGGLGQKTGFNSAQSDISAYVGGNVTVNQYKVPFYIDYDNDNGAKVVKSGRIFGSNNLNGSPQGNVTVTIYGTATGNVARTAEDPDNRGVPQKGANVTPTYELAAVYGGGNLADYSPTGKKTNVIIQTCDVSVQEVYGGGNAAAVPETDVLINGAYEIGYVFGGGNGKDRYKNDSGWQTNPGANVGGNTKTLLQGGFVHEAYGASNEKGNIGGTVSINAGTGGDCALEVGKLVGAGKNADLYSDVNLILGCMPSAKIDQIFGGADNANVYGNVELTVTSGNYANVFGGNNLGGIITGYIKLNIEETGECDIPITIDNLYLGGNQAAYSKFGYYVKTTEANGVGDPSETPFLTNNKLTLEPRTSADDSHKPVKEITGKNWTVYSGGSGDEYPTYFDPILNVISCTRIDNIFGGGYGSNAVMYASPTVNLNMIPGNLADQIDPTDPDKSNLLGVIGNVYGGGEQADVYGKATINIGTESTVTLNSIPDDPETDDVHENVSVVKGANVSNVYGGGKNANIHGDTEVNIGTLEYSSEHHGGISIAHDVYGGGYGASTNVTGTTTVYLGATGVGNSTITGDIYGGSAFGTVNTAQVNLYHGSVRKVFGGGMGYNGDPDNTEDQDITAHVTAGTTVTLNGATVTTALYGGSNINGTIGTTATVHLLSGSVGNAEAADWAALNAVFGGGLGKNTSTSGLTTLYVGSKTTTPSVSYSGSTQIYGNIYGGSENGEVSAVAINLYGDGNTTETIHGNVYGGGYETATGKTAATTVNVTLDGATFDLTKSGIGQIFGANNVQGSPSGHVTVQVLNTGTNGAGGYGVENVFGGGNVADYSPTSSTEKLDVIINGSTAKVGNVFGGGNQAGTENGAGTDVKMQAGTVVNAIYGGNNDSGTVDGGTSVTVTGGNVGTDWESSEPSVMPQKVFGGGFGKETLVKGSVIVNVGYNNSGNATIWGDVYGGSAMGKVNATLSNNTYTSTTGATTNVNLIKGTLKGDLYGGGLGKLEVEADPENNIAHEDAIAADVYGPVTVTVTGGTARDVFGANNLYGMPQSTVQVLINGTDAATAPAYAIANVYGGGNLAAYTGNPTVTMAGGNANNVFGGGYGSTAVVTGNPSVTVQGSGDIRNNVYGGGNQAQVAGNTNVTIQGGTVTNDVFGGGNLANVTNNVNVTVSGGQMNDVYGGGALAHTNTANWNAEGVSDGTGEWATGNSSNTNTTTVSITGGTIHDVFGGALGNATIAPFVYGDITVNLNENVAGTSKGAILNRIFGANNLNGTPKGHVKVHVFATQHPNESIINDKTPLNYEGTNPAADADGRYDVKAVYGGGNLSAYEPKETTEKTEVIIDGCSTTSIKQVYGGGNAASVPASEVTVNGSQEIYEVFGGGNGYDDYTLTEGNNTVWYKNPGANVGYKNYTHWVKDGSKGDGTSQLTAYEPVDNDGVSTKESRLSSTYVYGTGIAKTNINGGYIHNSYGGSNSKGNIREIAQSIYHGDGDCQLRVEETYGGGKDAPIDGRIDLQLDCMQEEIDMIFGGSQNADVNSDIVLTITNGHYNKVFGGNNTGGFIYGSITVNIEETNDCNDIEIGSLYGGGYLAPYSIYGYKNGAPRTRQQYEEELAALGDNPTDNDLKDAGLYGLPYNSPIVNVISATKIDNVFGGGYGSGAVIHGNPTVNINMIPGVHATEIDRDGNGADNDPHHLGTIGNVYGGGEEANVFGDATVNIGTQSQVTLESVETDKTRYVEGAYITGNVYGGGKDATIDGQATINVGTVNYNTGDGFEGIRIEGNVFGGGQGSSTNITGQTTVKLGANGVGNSTITGDIYGGSAFGTVTTAQVNLYSGTVANVFGGGMGQDADANANPAKQEYTAHVTTSTAVKLDGATVTTAIYGGSNVRGEIGSSSVPANATVTLLSGTVGNSTYNESTNNWATVNSVFGGGLGANTHTYGNTIVNVGTKTPQAQPSTDYDYAGTANIYGNIYGGSSRGSISTVDVNLYRGTIYGNVYGGGYYTESANAAATTVNVTLDGADFDFSHDGIGQVFGANNAQGSPSGHVKVQVVKTGTNSSNGYGVANVFGGGNQADYNPTNNDEELEVLIDGSSAYINNVFGGGNRAGTQNNAGTNVKLNSGSVINAIYGGNNASGTVDGSTQVTVSGGSIGTSWAQTAPSPMHRAVFGGGYGQGTLVKGSVTVNIGQGENGSDNIWGDVYGGSAMGIVNATLSNNTYTSTTGATTNVNLIKGTVRGDLYGGGLGDNTSPKVAADVYGPVTVTVTDGTASNVYGANNLYGAPQSTVNVNIQGGTVTNVYGGGNQAAYAGSTNVNMTGGTVAKLFGGGYGASASVGGTSVTMAKTETETGGTAGDIYGGGDLAPVTGSVTVSIEGGTTTNVYGGGALANTNTANWNESSGSWAEGNSSATYTTTVSLKGGTVTDLYGGALGDASHYATVYGDVLVEINNINNTQLKGGIVNRVFGANNANGSPKGNITVHVYGTQKHDEDLITKKAETDHDTYDVSAVYGGGNEAAYVPALALNGTTVFKTNVIIEGCDLTSIQTVYGGGNAAPVPETNIEIRSAYEIGTVFGGGNGKDAKSNGDPNPGADVGVYDNSGTPVTYGSGNANTSLIGGYIHAAFGGSNEKGNIKGTVNIQVNDDPSVECTLKIGELYGAGKNADIEGNLIVTLECLPESEIGEIYGGAENANVYGDVELTITSGTFGKVFGGNKTSGAIFGHIVLNIEETGCRPINIDELYGCGNDAAYSKFGYYVVTTDGTGNPGSGPTLSSNGKLQFRPRTSANDTHKPVKTVTGNTWTVYSGEGDDVFTAYSDPILNVISCTRIGQVYGGGYGENAVVYGNPNVNINQIYGKAYNNNVYNAKATALGKIGDVFGGGNLAQVNGNPVLNIGTVSSVNMVTEPDYLGERGTDYTYNSNTHLFSVAVQGVKITGSVYGGGNLANIDGTTTVNVGAESVTLPAGISISDNVFGGGKGSSVVTKARVTGNTNVNIHNGALNKNVYGGGELAQVGGNTNVKVYNGTIGTTNIGEYTVTDGNVFGGGLGSADKVQAGLIEGNTDIDIQNGTVKMSVYGGGQLAQVGGDTDIDISGGTIGTSGQGGALYGNVYGGGFGGTDNIEFGLIKGNTNISISGTPTILHNVYGGGAYGSVGAYNQATDEYISGGNARVEITGGTIGTNGVENGMVFGSSRGDVAAPGSIHDALAWVNNATVIIGTENSGTDFSTPLIKGSVYGSGENGHTKNNTEVYIYSGTIGTTPDGTAADATRGNVYGGGCGTDKYDSDDDDDIVDSYNPMAGIVLNNASVYISGGHIIRDVYGAGAMGSVGTATVGSNHETIKEGDGAFYDFGLSWPAQLTYPTDQGNTTTGKTTVQITGGRIGSILNGDVFGGDVFGAARGEAGDRYAMAPFANVRETEVTINYSSTPASTDATESATQYVLGSVYGGGANGHVSENASVTVTNGLIGGSVFGGGDGTGTYSTTLWIPDPDDPENTNAHIDSENQEIHSWTAGKVYGNTSVIINGGHVIQNVYGGGKYGSVGKGNYAGGNDDYSPIGYGELPPSANLNLWTNKDFTGTGKATVTVNAGTIGTQDGMLDDMPTGNVFGSSRGKAANDVGRRTPRYKYVPDFMLGYVNETEVNIGDATHSPVIYGSVYGGGQDGHVRRDTKVTVNNGTIGVINGGKDRGNVYGAGSGLGKNDSHNALGGLFNNSSGSVTCTTDVIINRGTIYQNVYGGGAMGSVGPPNTGPFTGLGFDELDNTTDAYPRPEGQYSNLTAHESKTYTKVQIKGGEIGSSSNQGEYGGNVYGASRGADESNKEFTNPAYNYATNIWSKVIVSNGTIHGNVFGGGENSIVLKSTNVTISGGSIAQSVFGGGRGRDALVKANTNVDMTAGTVSHSVYGGGMMGSVGDTLNTIKHEPTEKSDGALYNFALSWPYEFSYSNAVVAGGQTVATPTGKATVNISGGTVNGDVYGASQGQAHGTVDVTDQAKVWNYRYDEALIANVRETQVSISGSSTTIAGSVYGGGEDGHVNENTQVTIEDGQISGSVYGGGKGYGDYSGILWTGEANNPTSESKEHIPNWLAGKVYGNTTVVMNGGHVLKNVYGGGDLGSVGKGNYAGGTDDYSVVGYGELPPKIDESTEGTIWDQNGPFMTSGIATVTINSGIIGSAGGLENGFPTGNVFGSSRGRAAIDVGQKSPRYKFVPDFFLGYVNETNVTIGNNDGGTPTIYGSVYGGGQDGHVRRNTTVTVNNGTIGQEYDSGSSLTAAQWKEIGNVLGAGSGLGLNAENHYNNSSGSVTGTTTVQVNGGTIYQNVYGGGALAMVGPPNIGPANGHGFDEFNNTETDYTRPTGFESYASHGSKTYTLVSINGGTIGQTDFGGNVYGGSRGADDTEKESLYASAYSTDIWSTVNIGGGTIIGSVFGGGEAGDVKKSVEVNITGGEIRKDVYGGGALAHTNTSNNNQYTGLNTSASTTTVNLKGGKIVGSAYGGGLGRMAGTGIEPVPATVWGDVTVKLNEEGTDNCVVTNIFGANNLNGTPKGDVNVLVYKTQNADPDKNNKPSTLTSINDREDNTKYGIYDVQAVYGGGNRADYEPAGYQAPHVLIDGCNDISINEVYGGGNAAAVPATNVEINGAYLINYVFGGGCGTDPNTRGANVGYKTYPTYDWGKDPNNNKSEYLYGGGSGNALVNLKGGYIINAFGGSNTNGDISGSTNLNISEIDNGCTLQIGSLYGAGKNADVDNDVNTLIDCPSSSIQNVYGGAEEANINGNVTLTITGGTFERVYGGNKTRGNISGNITVNIEETDAGCRPIYITDALYGGCFDAPYSGTNNNGLITVNVKSFTEINDIYGGSYGATATVRGNTIVNINEAKGRWAGQTYSGHLIPDQIGTITGNIYGGGNAANVIGNTTVNIGTLTQVPLVSKPVLDANNQPTFDAQNNPIYTMATVEGVNIQGNIYGGGNQANVDGNTTLNIGFANLTTYSGTLIHGSVFGGGMGQTTQVTGNVDVNIGNIAGGYAVINGDVYGGSALGSTNNANWNTVTNTWVTGLTDANKKTTHVKLLGGTINGSAFGGGLGQITPTPIISMVYGDVLVELNGIATPDGKVLIPSTSKGCAVNQVFGANNYNGTPTGDVTVHVYGTQHSGLSTISDKYNPPYYGNDHDANRGNTEGYKAYLERLITTVKPESTVIAGVDASVVTAAQQLLTNLSAVTEESLTDEQKASITTAANNINAQINGLYDVHAVYGGGNEAAYIPEGETRSTNVIIEGCDFSSIQYVYGGGNAAPVPATNVLIKGNKVIDYVFGGGNGTVSSADVGYYNLNNAQQQQGSGNANTHLMSGLIHYVYGGSNTTGTIRGNALIETVDNDHDGSCETLTVRQMFAAGKDADIEGGSVAIFCNPQAKVDVYYGGAQNANLGGNAELTISGGEFGKIFGGNKESGAIFGHIILNIEETDCNPIKIDELYGCGDQAPYSIYGYYLDNENNLHPRTSPNDGNTPVRLRRNDEAGEGTYVAYTGAFTTYDNPVVNIISCTSIGKVFGGGYGENAKVYGSPTVNINMIPGKYATGVDRDGDGNADGSAHRLGTIGVVYGGGNAADIIGNATVNVGTAATVEMRSLPKVNVLDASNNPIPERDGQGNIVYEDDGETPKYLKTYQTSDVEGAYIQGNVYGGGLEAIVSGNTRVNIGVDNNNNNNNNNNSIAYSGEGFEGIEITGSVFGAGQGLATDVQSAQVKGNSTVRMGAGWIHGSVYGGGERASVGDFTYDENSVITADAATGTGISTVYIMGGKVGPTTLTMPMFTGHVFGAGKGETGIDAIYPKLNYVQSTNVTITGTAFIKGSVYGGSENGHVRGDTYVTISGGQIGSGYNTSTSTDLDRVYTDDEWAYDVTTDNTKFLYEANSWPYGLDTDDDGKKDLYAPYDMFADESGNYPSGSEITSSEGGRPQTLASDGHTFYGNVFGGGSGYFPYAAGKWSRTAGAVEGNTNVTITGGHILTNIYGGNEMTNVGHGLTGTGGTSTVRFGGTATLGVPRTLAQIAAHPVTCYLFGAGKGDTRVLFNKDTNVKDVIVEITGGRIYGSVFGGGEDGHVFGDVRMTINQNDYNNDNTKTRTQIGTWGTSYVDGNVFGGGRGYTGDAYTAGNVGGSVKLDINGGTMLGSIYGGGRLGSVGYGLYSENETGYGEMRNDGFNDAGESVQVYDYDNDGTPDGFRRGYIDVTISGNTVIGNEREFGYDANNPLTHTTGGNVFAGGMGRRVQLDGETPITIDWTKLGNVKSTRLTIGNGVQIYGNVYGGGEIGAVTGSHSTNDDQGQSINVGTEVIINNATIGHAINDAQDVKGYFGSVYGGGMGITYSQDNNTVVGGGNVADNTYVRFNSGSVKASIYGGGELAQVNGSAIVDVNGGTVGQTGFGGAEYGNVYGGGKGNSQIITSGLVNKDTKVTISGNTTTIYHNVYGGGAFGSVGTFTYDSDNVITGHTENTGTASVYITGGTIGTTGQENGMVFGSSRGDVGAPGSIHDKLAWVYDTKVTIGDTVTAGSTPAIKGSVFGGGENGHNYHDAYVRVHSGTIGTTPDGTAADATRGNVYGGGCGTDKYDSDDNGTEDSYNPMAGIVLNNAKVRVTGGTVLRNVYGAGAMGSVGTVTNDISEAQYIHNTEKTGDGAFYGFGLSWPVELVYPTTTGQDAHTYTGKTTVEVTGGTIGVDGNDNGDVYGAARGEAGDRYAMAGLANVREAQVTIGAANVASTTVPKIWGSVFGGSANGHVYEDASVTVHGGSIEKSVFGGGNGDGTYQSILWIPDPDDPDDIDKHKETAEPQPVHSITAGKVYGNTYVTINGGHVKHNVYGGGNLGSVGKGNYAGGTDDYSVVGYGELPAKIDESTEGTLWDNTNFTLSGIATVTINGGTIGTNTGTAADLESDGLFPYGNVFGSSRGVASIDVGRRSPRYKYVPDFFVGYVNETHVTIGTGNSQPSIYGSVYGGGQDGHVRRGTNVIVNNAIIGINGNTERDRGNVFGAGSGVGTNSQNECNTSSGSVTTTTNVEINGGIIYRNVYGGGALAMVGPPFAGNMLTVAPNVTIPYDEFKETTGTHKSNSYTSVNIKGGSISGSVYGASRGPSDALL